MAISFNFDNSKLPVKEESNKCLNCLRYHKCSENIGRCGCSLDFIVSPTICSHFKDRMRIFKRQLHISFCLYDYNKDNNDLKFQDSGLGLIVNYANTDDNILNDIINNKKLMSDVNNKISAYFNKTNPIIVPIISAERYFEWS